MIDSDVLIMFHFKYERSISSVNTRKPKSVCLANEHGAKTLTGAALSSTKISINLMK